MCDNVVISLLEDCVQVGIVELKIFKKGEHEGECFIWNLHVNAERWGKGYGRILLKAATNIAKNSDCKEAILDWNIKENPKWPVWEFDWYIRNGFEGREFGQDRTFMVKTLKEEREWKNINYILMLNKAEN